MNNSLVILSNATKMLAEVKTIDEAKNLMDVAAAAKIYAQKHKLGQEAVEYAREIELSAQIKLGEILKEMEKNKGTRGKTENFSGGQAVVPPDKNPTLNELGINKNLSSESQKLASLPEEEKEKVIKGKTSKKKAINNIKQEERKESLQTKAKELPAEKFQVIYCDPPWKYSNSGLNGSAESKYPTMALDELCKMNIQSVTAENAVIFMWSTNSLLEKFMLKIKAYKKGMWVYPGALKRHLGVSSQVIYNALNVLKQDGILETYYEVYCPKCSKTSGEVFATITEIPEEIYCETCNEEISAIDNTIMIYKVVDDGNDKQ